MFQVSIRILYLFLNKTKFKKKMSKIMFHKLKKYQKKALIRFKAVTITKKKKTGEADKLSPPT